MIPAQLDSLAATPDHFCVGSTIPGYQVADPEEHVHPTVTGTCYVQWLEVDDRSSCNTVGCSLTLYSVSECVNGTLDGEMDTPSPV